jgi:hypothetical protein
VSDEYEIALMRCPDCGKEMNLSIFKGESIRNTYCGTCGHAVIWEKVEMEEEEKECCDCKWGQTDDCTEPEFLRTGEATCMNDKWEPIEKVEDG